MSKSGSNLITFPKFRRTEQTGLTQRGFPVRSLGLLVMTMVGAAWAINPTSQAGGVAGSGGEASVDRMVFEGEPQVVAQLMGAVVGPEQTPTRELRAVEPRAGSGRRVVVSAPDQEVWPDVRAQAEFLTAVERLESELAAQGSYPAVPSREVGIAGAGYRTDGERFQLEAGALRYDSESGFVAQAGENVEGGAYRVSGFLQSVTKGWGPWEYEVQQFSPTGREEDMELEWLAAAEPAPNWSARLYFPVSREHTGYAFRKNDGSTIYRSGELLYDGVSGTFQMKLHRKEPAAEAPLRSAGLEKELSVSAGGCEMVGDAGFLTDLGLLRESEGSRLVHLSTPIRLPLSAGGALDGLALAAFSRHARPLTVSPAPLQDGEAGGAAAVGRFSLVDKLGQVHEVRIRAGRGGDYDWVVGQLCPVEDGADPVVESVAHDDAEARETKATIIAGK